MDRQQSHITHTKHMPIKETQAIWQHNFFKKRKTLNWTICHCDNVNRHSPIAFRPMLVQLSILFNVLLWKLMTFTQLLLIYASIIPAFHNSKQKLTSTHHHHHHLYTVTFLIISLGTPFHKKTFNISLSSHKNSGTFLFVSFLSTIYCFLSEYQMQHIL